MNNHGGSAPPAMVCFIMGVPPPGDGLFYHGGSAPRRRFVLSWGFRPPATVIY